MNQVIDSPEAASKALSLNMMHESASRPMVVTDAFGWVLLTRTAVPWHRLDPRSKTCIYTCMADMAVIQQAFTCHYRPQLIRSGNVSELRAKVLVVIQEISGDLTWSYADEPITLVAPTLAPEKVTTAEATTSRPKRQATKQISQPKQEDTISDADNEAEEQHDVQIRHIINLVHWSTVGLTDGKKGSPLEGQVGKSFRAFIKVSSYIVKFI